MFSNRPVSFDSKAEEYVYNAMVKYQLEFDYQVPVLGYYDLRGAIILDFLVYNPFRTAVQIHGRYWHSGEMGMDDQYQLAILKQLFEGRVVTFWASELETQEDANRMVRTWLVQNAGSPKD